MKSSWWLKALGIGLAIVVVAGAVAVVLVLRARVPMDIDHFGGLLLVYEIDADTLPADVTPDDMAAALRRRLDNAGMEYVTVRPLDPRRYEIAVPRVRDHETQVRDIKDLFALTGTLEFRIVANEHDDAEAVQHAQDFFNRARADPKLQDELRTLAETGKPPPPPRDRQGGQTFIASDDVFHPYSWVELGPDERYQLGLDNAAENDPTRDTTWKEVAQARQAGIPYVLPGSRTVIYSRPHLVQPPPARDQDKKHEYFYLTREAEPGKAITGAYLERAEAEVDEKMRPAIRFRLTQEGGDLFFDLTSKNTPRADETRRHLAVILDGKVVTAPNLQSAVRRDGVITGLGDKKQVDHVVAVLRAGALPVPVKPQPVSETVVEPKTGR